jgi:molybdopterin synthase catalytic subunit
MAERAPSVDEWLREAKADPAAADCGMFLVHNGVVRRTARAQVREGKEGVGEVRGMDFDYDAEKVARAVERARTLPGIRHVRVWLNRGRLEVGDDIMLVLIGGDIRPRVVDALQTLVGEIKNECVLERELIPEEI